MTSRNDLEDRVEALETSMLDTREIAVGAARDARRALRAHQANIRVLNAVRTTQAEHSEMLAEHSEMLAENRTAIADNRTAIADNRTAIADVQTTVGRILVGVHGIEAILTRLARDRSEE